MEFDFLYLPPVVVVHVDHLQNVALFKRQAGVTTRDQVVFLRVVREVRPEEHLYKKQGFSLFKYILQFKLFQKS